jgi:hypothetical protein
MASSSIIKSTDLWVIPNPARAHYETSDTEIALSKKFAQESGESKTHYNQARNASKAMTDIYNGKLGEFKACTFVEDYLGIPIQPSLIIYTKDMKDFSRDILVAGVNTHVKTCGTENWGNRGPSWVFQLSDKYGRGGTDSLFNKSPEDLQKELGIFVQIEGRVGRILLVSAMDVVMENLEPPQLDKYRGIKMCLYLDRFK